MITKVVSEAMCVDDLIAAPREKRHAFIAKLADTLNKSLMQTKSSTRVQWRQIDPENQPWLGCWIITTHE